MDCLKVRHNIQKELRDYIITNNLKSLVVGISGGIDSALIAALAQPVCDTTHIKLYGRSIPILTNKMEEMDRAEKIGKAFCHDFKVVDLGSMFHEVNNMLEDEEGCKKDGHRDKIRQGNVKARLRMIYLYNLAFMNDGMVLSTDNYTELMVGFWTLHGDVGDYGMIQNLWKGEVYELSNYMVKELFENRLEEEAIALKECVDAVPTDGLGVTNSDLDQLGAKTYVEVDNILKNWLDKTNEKSQQEAEHPVVKRHETSKYKRENPYNIPRHIIDA
jgi:NAD+ synthetase